MPTYTVLDRIAGRVCNVKRSFEAAFARELAASSLSGPVASLWNDIRQLERLVGGARVAEQDGAPVQATVNELLNNAVDNDYDDTNTPVNEVVDDLYAHADYVVKWFKRAEVETAVRVWQETRKGTVTP